MSIIDITNDIDNYSESLYDVYIVSFWDRYFIQNIDTNSLEKYYRTLFNSDTKCIAYIKDRNIIGFITYMINKESIYITYISYIDPNIVTDLLQSLYPIPYNNVYGYIRTNDLIAINLYKQVLESIGYKCNIDVCDYTYSILKAIKYIHYEYICYRYIIHFLNHLRLCHQNRLFHNLQKYQTDHLTSINK